MNNKTASICAMSFYPLDGTSINWIIGNNRVTVENSIQPIPVDATGISLNENRQTPGSFIEIELSAKVTDTSEVSEKKLGEVCYKFGMIALKYTNGVTKLLGSRMAPIMLTYQKVNTPAVFELSCKASQPEFSKFLVG